MKTNWIVMMIAALFFAACGETTDTSKAPVEFPGQLEADGKADWRTNFYTDFRGTLNVDDTAFDTYSATRSNWYHGYEIQLEAGDTVELRAGANRAGFDSVMGVYGPQKANGRWGRLIASNDDAPMGGTLDSYIQLEVQTTGNYLILVRDYNWRAADYFVSAGCVAGSCLDICQPVLCKIYCEFGHQTDENGCEVCACNPSASCQWVTPPPYVRCAGIETWGKNPADDTCCQYPTPCNVPGDWEQFPTEAACEGLAGEGEGCSMYGTQCAAGLECAYQCPDGSNDPNCNLGINPSGTCVTPTLAECTTDADCMETGCSGQICAAQHVITTCEYRPEYACYNEPTTNCGCNNGSCGWAQTAELATCLGN